MAPDTAVPSAPFAALDPTVARVHDEPAPSAPPAPPAAPPSVRLCTNCGAEAGDSFCPRCGQEQHDWHRSMRSIFGEALDAFAGWDAKIPASLWLLLARPGRLTQEFLRGRRARYLRPLRLYLMLSVAFFVTLQYEAARSKSRPFKFGQTSGLQAGVRRTPVPTDSITSVVQAAEEGFRRGLAAKEAGGSALDSIGLRALAERKSARPATGVKGWLKTTLESRMQELADLPPAQRDRAIRDAIFSKLGNLAICLVPVFALLLRVLWMRARLYYAEHFVVALHTHAFAFGALTLIVLLADAKRAAAGLPHGATALRGTLTAAGLGLRVWLPVYPFMAFRRIYGGSRGVTLVKYVVLGGLYVTALLVGFLLTVFAVLLVG